MISLFKKHFVLLAGVFLAVFALPVQAASIERVTTPSGIEAWLVQDETLPIVTMAAGFRGGSTLDPDGKAGLAAMVAALLDEGAGPYDSQTFRSMLENKAIYLWFEAGKTMFSANLKTLKENRDEAFDLMRLALTEPRFAPEDIARVRAQILAALQRDAQQPATVASRAWLAHVYPDHPYGIPTRGTAASVESIDEGDLRKFARFITGRDQLLVAVVGDISSDELVPLLEKAFGDLPESTDAGRALAELPVPEPHLDGQTIVIERENPQSVATFGGPGLLRTDTDWYPAYVMNYVLGGGGFASRLTEEVREKRGLSYSVYTYLQPFMLTGPLVGSVASSNDRIALAMDVIRSEWRRMELEGITETELENAKTYLIGSYPLSMTSTSDLAAIMLSAQVYDLGIDFLDLREQRIRDVTLDDVGRVAKRLMVPEKLTTVVVGKPETDLVGE